MEEQEPIEIVEERLTVGKRTNERVVRLTARPVEREETVRLELATEELHTERIARGEFVDGVPPVRQEGDVTVIPIVEEVSSCA